MHALRSKILLYTGNLLCDIDNCDPSRGNFTTTSDCCVQTPSYICVDIDACCSEKAMRGVKVCSGKKLLYCTLILCIILLPQCGPDEGHCEHDGQCQDGLICGSKNCKQPYGNDHNCCAPISCNVLLDNRGIKVIKYLCRLCFTLKLKIVLQCAVGQGDCGSPGSSQYCEDGLICGIDNCNTTIKPWHSAQDDCCVNASTIVCNPENENCCQKKLEDGIPVCALSLFNA